MKVKESYTFDELCRGLTIPMSKFCQLAGITEPTLIRLRNGYSGRQHTLNLILEAFSKVYGIELTLENVSGLTLQEKPNQKLKKQPTEEKPLPTTRQTKTEQTSNVEPKRAYNHKKNAGLPDGCIPATEFAANHGIKRETFRDHQNIGLGPGSIHGPDIPEDGSVLVKDYVRAEERNKRVLKDGRIEKERYLTQDQQHEAIQFWKRHDVAFIQCDQVGCSCHISEELIKYP